MKFRVFSKKKSRKQIIVVQHFSLSKILWITTGLMRFLLGNSKCGTNRIADF
jgi:hypothetical protein